VYLQYNVQPMCGETLSDAVIVVLDDYALMTMTTKCICMSACIFAKKFATPSSKQVSNWANIKHVTYEHNVDQRSIK